MSATTLTQAAATSAHPADRDASDPALLPPETPLAMPEQDFSRRIALERRPWRRGIWVPRAAVFLGAAMLTAAFAYELYNVLAFVRMTPIQLLFLVLSTAAFGWIALGSLSAALGFLPLFAGEKADTIAIPEASGPLEARTALLFPVYHEDPARIAATIEAVAEDLRSLGKADKFAVFILSDTRGDEAGQREEAAYRALIARVGSHLAIHYRRRLQNTARKAGNIKDWVERFGAGYEHFVILDADSIMSGTTLVRLSRAMESDPKSGLIQTVPRLVGGITLLQRLQQFATSVYGPSVAAGLALWHRDQGNYWGHNAIIRTLAFATAAGLPELPGKAPFGGHIQSHDFVEAVLLQRAGWGVHMAPTLEGSFEGLPPTLIDLVVRDRRWAQGNLQHLSIVGQAGLSTMGRVHLAMGAASYLVSAIWAASLAVGVVLALQGQQILPSYFQDSKTLFPIWPVIDPGAAYRLFLATMMVVLLPKALGLALELRRVREAREQLGVPRAIAGTLVETVFSMLLAPIMMVTQTVAVAQIALGRDSGWRVQRRDDGHMPFDVAVHFHWRHMLLGAILTLVVWQASSDLLMWMAPVLLGLLAAAPVSWLVAQPAGRLMGAILATPEERNPPAILERTGELAILWHQRLGAAQANAAALDQGARRSEPDVTAISRLPQAA